MGTCPGKRELLAGREKSVRSEAVNDNKLISKYPKLLFIYWEQLAEIHR